MSNYNEQLSESARIGRIAEILSRGITMKLVNDRKALEAAQDVIEDNTNDQKLASLNTGLSDILNYIVLKRSVSPKEIQAHFSMPRKTAYRKLKKLLDTGLIKKEGNTKSCQFVTQRLTH